VQTLRSRSHDKENQTSGSPASELSTSERRRKGRKKLHKKEPGWEPTAVKMPASMVPPLELDGKSFLLGLTWYTSRVMVTVCLLPFPMHIDWRQLDQDTITSPSYLANIGALASAEEIPNTQINVASVGAVPGAPFDRYKPHQEKHQAEALEHRLNNNEVLPHNMERVPQHPSFTSGSPPTEIGPHSRTTEQERRASLYSMYSYYDLPVDGSANRSLSQASFAGPALHHPKHVFADPNASSNPRPASPHLPPDEARFQPDPHGPSRRWTNITLSKAKFSINQQDSLQMTSTGEPHLTTPKVSGPDTKRLDLTALDPDDPLVCLHLGIDAHEQGDLAQSAKLFEKSAEQGCGLGMLMYGLTLRHGWVSGHERVSLWQGNSKGANRPTAIRAVNLVPRKGSCTSSGQPSPLYTSWTG